MEEFLKYLEPRVWFFIVFTPLFTILTVGIFKKYTDVTKKIKPKYLSWIISTIYWIVLILSGEVEIRSHFILNIIGPGILIGLLSNSYYDAIKRN